MPLHSSASAPRTLAKLPVSEKPKHTNGDGINFRPATPVPGLEPKVSSPYDEIQNPPGSAHQQKLIADLNAQQTVADVVRTTDEASKIAQLRQHLTQAGNGIRGLSQHSELVNRALAALVQGKPVHAPVFWGFRPFKKGDQLLPQEVNTLKMITNLPSTVCGDGLASRSLMPSLILADLHAQHNGLHKQSETDYYEAVAAAAKEFNLPTVRLSQIVQQLQSVQALPAGSEQEVAEHLKEIGAEHVSKYSNEREETIRVKLQVQPDQPDQPIKLILNRMLDKESWTLYKSQAKNMKQRLRPDPNYLHPSELPSALTINDSTKAADYVHFRAGEGLELLPHLGKHFVDSELPEQEGFVLPVHICGPEANEILLSGLFVNSASAETSKPRKQNPFGFIFNNATPWGKQPDQKKLKSAGEKTDQTLISDRKKAARERQAAAAKRKAKKLAVNNIQIRE